MKFKPKQIIAIVILGVAAYSYLQEELGFGPDTAQESAGTDSALQNAYRNQQSDVQVRGEGVVTRVLADDNEGSRHQRFILQLTSGQTLLVAHNIDLAPRIDGLRTGDTVAFFGEYEWNSSGGVLHWTHRDPNGRHQHGWLKRGEQTYQ